MLIEREGWSSGESVGRRGKPGADRPGGAGGGRADPADRSYRMGLLTSRRNVFLIALGYRSPLQVESVINVFFGAR